MHNQKERRDKGAAESIVPYKPLPHLDIPSRFWHRFEAVAIVEGVPATSLAYHNTEGRLHDAVEGGNLKRRVIPERGSRFR